MTQYIEMPIQNQSWYLTKSNAVNLLCIEKTANNFQLEHKMCLFILCMYVLYVSTCPRLRAWPAFALPRVSTFDEKKGCMNFIVMDRSPHICYLTQVRIPWKYSPIHFQQYQPSQMQILHDKNIIIEIKTTHQEIKLILFREHMNCSYHWCRFYQSGPYFFPFSLLLWTLHLTQHIGPR